MSYMLLAPIVTFVDQVFTFLLQHCCAVGSSAFRRPPVNERGEPSSTSTNTNNSNTNTNATPYTPASWILLALVDSVDITAPSTAGFPIQMELYGYMARALREVVEIQECSGIWDVKALLLSLACAKANARTPSHLFPVANQLLFSEVPGAQVIGIYSISPYLLLILTHYRSESDL